MKKIILIFIGFILILNFSSCKEKEKEREFQIEKEAEIFSGTGTIESVSNISKGTYKFEIENFTGNNLDEKYLEVYSKSFGVGNYTSKKVFISGVFEKGSSKNLLINSIKEIKEVKEEIKEFKNDAGGYSISLDKNLYEFVKGGKNSKVLNQSGQVLISIDVLQTKIPEQKPEEEINISGEPEVKEKKEVKQEKVESEYSKKDLDNGFEISKTITVGESEFSLKIKADYGNLGGEAGKKQEENVKKIVNSFKFFGINELADSTCGGEKYKLCPKGYYCEVFDSKDPNSFGSCKIIKSLSN